MFCCLLMFFFLLMDHELKNVDIVASVYWSNIRFELQHFTELPFTGRRDGVHGPRHDGSGGGLG